MKTLTKTKTNRGTAAQPKEDKFITKILENLDKVNAAQWEGYAALNNSFPTNLFTKKRYSGFNVMALFLDAMVNNFSSVKYATFNSIAKAGGRLKKGAKGCVIEFFSFVYKHEETGRVYTWEQVREMTAEQLMKIKKFPCLKSYVVFNSQFIENIEELNLNIETEEAEEQEILEVENAETFINKIIVEGNLDLRFGMVETAFYAPSSDYVKLPKREFFISTQKFYSTLFHEIIHWTGHKSRLNREMTGHSDKESYSFEELIAEMGAMLCSLQFGLAEEFINSVRYLKGWSSFNRTDTETLIRKAFIESKKAKKFLEQLEN